MSQRINYNGREVNLIAEWEYKFNKHIWGHTYEGLILLTNGRLVDCILQYDKVDVALSPYIALPQTVVWEERYPVYDAALEEEAKRLLEINWYTPLSDANGWVGVAATGAEYTPNALRLVGGNVDILSKLAKHSSTIYRWGKIVGTWTVGIGIGLDFVGYLIYKNNPDSPNGISGYKFGLNSGITAYGVLVPGGVFASTLYFMVDVLYPGGWQGALDNNADLQRQNEKIVPGFRLYPKDF